MLTVCYKCKLKHSVHRHSSFASNIIVLSVLYGTHSLYSRFSIAQNPRYATENGVRTLDSYNVSVSAIYMVNFKYFTLWLGLDVVKFHIVAVFFLIIPFTQKRNRKNYPVRKKTQLFHSVQNENKQKLLYIYSYFSFLR